MARTRFMFRDRLKSVFDIVVHVDHFLFSDIVE